MVRGPMVSLWCRRSVVPLLVAVGLGPTAIVVGRAAAATPPPATVTFLALGPQVQQWIVPVGVTAVTYDVIGADGGSLTGFGARVTGTMTVTPGMVLDLWVGLQGQETSDLGKAGAGGWGGQNGMRHGGAGATSQQGASSGGGGGATEVDAHGVAGLSGVLIVAGGGGGVGGRALGAATTTTCSQSGAGGCGAILGTGQGVPGTAGLIGAFPGGAGGGGDFGGGAAAPGATAGGASDTGAGGSGGAPVSTASAGAGGGGGGGYGGGGGGGAGGTGSGDAFSTSAGGGGGAGRSIAPPTPARAYNSASPYHGAGKIIFTYQPPAISAGATRFVAVAPSRLLDTRVAGDLTGGSPVAANGTLDLQVSGRGGVPLSNVAAVVVNVTVAGATGPGFVTVWPAGDNRPQVSNLNVTEVGQNIANLVTIRLGATGKISLYTQAGTHLVVDIEGYYEPVNVMTAAGRFTPLSPSRVLDTRIALGVPGTSPVPAGGTVDLAVAGHGGVPSSGARAVVMNVTAAESTAPGFLTVWPGDGQRPEASTLNVTFAGQNIANLVIVPLGSNGHVHMFSQSGGHLVADVAGWFTDGSASAGSAGLFVPLAPSRILDTRVPVGVPTAGPVLAGHTIGLTVAGHGGAPASGFIAVVANITAAEALAPGFVTVSRRSPTSTSPRPGRTSPTSPL
jgi:hypothetical protein